MYTGIISLSRQGAFKALGFTTDNKGYIICNGALKLETPMLADDFLGVRREYKNGKAERLNDYTYKLIFKGTNYDQKEKSQTLL